MSGLSNFEKMVLKGWFDRRIIRCGGDPKAYDFEHEIDRKIGYYENKRKFEKIVDRLCGPTIGNTKREQEELAHYAEEADAYQAHKLANEGITCNVCGKEAQPIDDVSAEMNKLICEMLCKAEHQFKKPDEKYIENVYEEF